MPGKTKPVQCFALGCSGAPKPGADFCEKDYKRLPLKLRPQSAETAKAAIVYLGKKDGFLAADTGPSGTMEERR